MTDPFIEEIKKRVEAATPGPWVGYKKSILGRTKDQIGSWVSSAPINKEADRLFIAHSRTDVPKLLALVELYESALNQYATAEFAECHNRYRNLFGEEECESWNQNLAKNALLEGENIKRGE